MLGTLPPPGGFRGVLIEATPSDSPKTLKNTMFILVSIERHLPITQTAITQVKLKLLQRRGLPSFTVHEVSSRG
jgi:hypothetical protein